MADTQRTLTELLALFADGQVTGSLTPEDVRDLLVSMAPVNGGIYISAAASTTVAVSATYYKCEGTTTLIPDATSKYLDMPADNRLRYTGVPTRNVMVEISGDVTLDAGTNIEIGFKIYKNGVAVAHTHSHVEIPANSKPAQFVARGFIEMATNDYVELWGENATDTNDFTVHDMVMTLDGKLV